MNEDIKKATRQNVKPKKRYTKSIQIRITFLTWILIVVAVSIYVVANFYSQKAIIIDRMKNEAINVAASIEQITASSVYNEDYTTVVDHCLPLVQKGESISYIYVVKYDGFALLFTDKMWTSETVSDKRFLKPALEENYEFYFEERIKENVFHYAYPFNYSGIDWGWIHVGLSLEKYNSDIKDTLWNSFFLTLLSLLIGLVVSAIFARRLIKPIQTLDSVSQQIAAGDLTVRANISTADELESLAHSFNIMTDELQKSRDELEQRVQDRTLELAKANKKLVAEVRARKRNQERLVASLKEKEVLLKEIHHRVKNNLQIISSLLYLQSRNITDEETALMFTDSRNRIISMALIHENLYRSDDLAMIDIKEYITNLTRELSSSYQQEGRYVALKLSIESIPLNIDKAIPCGLIINELVSNAYKYAFESRIETQATTNEINVHLKMTKAEKVSLLVSDNGKGLHKDVDFRNSPSLGLQLVNSLVGQLDGEINYENKNGTTFEIRFNLNGE